MGNERTAGLHMLLKKSTDTDALKGHGFIRAAKAFVKRAALAAEGWF
jgi:hypothetical protein